MTPMASESNSFAAFSIWQMFLHADLVVQAVMLVLIASSIWCWSIIFAKSYTFRRLQMARSYIAPLLRGNKPTEEIARRLAASPQDPFSILFLTGFKEWQNGLAQNTPYGIEGTLQATVTQELEDLEQNLGFLATVGSTAPFVGLFGTVWGIMHSFQGIAAMKSTNLAVVAPGIAEALLATALGLVAAIPAVVAYNRFSSLVNRYGNQLDQFAHELTRYFSGQSKRVL